MSFKDNYPNLADFENICRVCLGRSTSQSIYSFNDKTKAVVEHNIADKLRLCCGIEVCLGDNLPSNICDVCSESLLKAYELRVLSENSDKILKLVLQSNNGGNRKKQTKIVKRRKEKQSSKQLKIAKKIITMEDEECEEIIWNDDGDNINEGTSYNSDISLPKGNCEDSNEVDLELQQVEDDCDENDIQDQSIDHLLQDVLRHSRPCDNKNVCPICDMKIVRCSLRKHFTLCHNTMIKKGYKCYGCDEILNTRAERELHEDLYCSKMPPGTIYTCSVCEATLSNREDFDRHLWSRHRGRPLPKTEDDDELPDTVSSRKEGYICETCGQVLRSLTTFNRHVMRHQGILWLECELCSFRTSDYRTLMVHKLRHEGRKPFQCQECPYTTERPEYLKVHQMRHTGERPYACPYCDYKTVNHSNLKKHKISHTNIKEFQCEACEKFYKSKKALKHHVLRSHENARMFYCKPCNTKYVGEEALNRHRDRKHPSGGPSIQTQNTNVVAL